MSDALAGLSDFIMKQFDEAEIIGRSSDDPMGFQFLNAHIPPQPDDLIEIAIEWKAGNGYGLSFIHSYDDELKGLFSASDEHYDAEEDVKKRILEKVGK